MPLKTKEHNELKCDNPDCEVGFSWCPEDVTTGKTRMPDGIYRFLILAVPGTEERWTFCSKYCLLEFMKNWKTRKSPEELKEEEAAKAKQAEKIEEITEKKEWTQANPTSAVISYDLSGR